MKIIKAGIPENRKTCKHCKCIFEYDDNDIMKRTYNDIYYDSSLAMQEHRQVRQKTYIVCPCCKKEYTLFDNAISEVRGAAGFGYNEKVIF